jgi:ribosomal protein S18 acetylase RimI-like enzyme
MNLEKECEPVALSSEQMITNFDCGNDDLNDFFNHDAIKYQEQLMCQTYFFRHYETGKVVCAFSLSADSLKAAWLPGSRRKKVKELIPREKNLQSYPAFLIGRLGVAAEFGNQGIGSQLLEAVKQLCFSNYSNLARFLLVDAYNNPSVLHYYRKNGFLPVFSVEEQERDYYKRPDDTEPLRTRFMYYDMIQWKRIILSADKNNL